jgi:pyrroline-5-carboxylate reductase
MRAMSSKERIVIAGGGTMGRALCEGVLASGLASPEQVCVAEPDSQRRVAIHADLGVPTAPDCVAVLPGAVLLVLAIKPQVFPLLAAQLAGAIPQGALLLSIMAGISTAALIEGTGHKAVVRAMPNTAARVRRAATVWYASPSLSPAQAELAGDVLSAIGEAIRVEQERQVDLATAVNGSGPAFVCLMAEAMIEGAVNIGLERDLASRLVRLTLDGTAALLQAGSHPAQVREGVTSPGGTTAAGLLALEGRAVRAAYIEAVRAAYQRTVELGERR